MSTTYTFGPDIAGVIDSALSRSAVEDPITQFIRGRMQLAQAAAMRCAMDGKVGSLTDEEKVVLAWVAGADIDYSHGPDGTMSMRTRNEVGFYLRDGRVHVVERKQ